MGLDRRRDGRPDGFCTYRVGCDLDRCPRGGGDDLRRLPRWGEEGPGRAEGRESGQREPQGEGSGGNVRPRSRNGPADDRDDRSSRVSRGAKRVSAFSNAARDTLKPRCREVTMPTVIDRRDVQQLVQQGAQLVEVLGAKEYEAEHIPGAINILLKTLNRATAKRLDSRHPVITYCHDNQ